jgi:hypothetical protein
MIRTHPRPLLMLLALFCGLALAAPAALAVPPAPADDDDDSARISVIVRAEPSVQVPPGGTLAYTITARNTGDVFADRVHVQVAYDPAQLTITDTQFARDGDWLSDMDAGSFTLVFGGVGQDKRHTATVYAQVSDTLPEGAVINLWAKYDWQAGQRSGHDNQANAAPVLVGPDPITSQWVWMEARPFRAPAGTTLRFFSDRFVPGERLKIWLASRDGIQRRRDFDTETNADGHVWIDYPTEGMPPGFYQFIAHGQRSDLVGGSLFIIGGE